MSATPRIALLGDEAGLRRALEGRDVDCVPAAAAELALVLSDGGAEALQALTRARAEHPDLPLLAVGPDPGARAVAAALRAGAEDWIPLPLDEDFSRAVEQCRLRRVVRREREGLVQALQGRGRRVEEERRALSRRVASVTAELETAHAQLASAHRELQGRVAQLVMLYRIGRDLSNHPNWDEALSRFLRSMRSFLEARGAGLLLTSDQGRVVQARRVDGLDEDLVRRACELLQRERPRTGSDPYLVPLEEVGRDRPTPCVDCASPWSETVLPLRHHDQDLGYLLLEKDYADGKAIAQDIYFLITVQTILTEEVAGAQAVSELRKLQRFQERTLDQVQSGIVTYDEEGRLLYANRRGRELLGRAVTAGDLRAVVRMGGEVVDLAGWAGQATATSPVVGEGWLSTGDGSAVPVSLKASRMAAEMPGLSHCIVLLEDQRATHELEAERRRAARQSEHLIMAAEWAHDVRTPLTGILHSAELLCEALPADSPKRRHFRVVREEVDRINDLVSRFLDFSRPAQLKCAPTDLAEVCERVGELLARRAEEAEVGLELELAEGEDPPRAVVDADQLQQVLLNLVTNALDASPRQGRVVLRLARESAPPELWRDGPVDHVAVLEVMDEGPGVPAEHRERLFVPFFTTKPEGTGLGLAIAEKIIRAHHGHLRYEPRGGRTVLRAVLPLDEDAEDAFERLQARG